MRQVRPWALAYAVADQATLAELRAARLPWGLKSGASERYFHRDLYLDTADGDLERLGMACRLRHYQRHGRELTVTIGLTEGSPSWANRESVSAMVPQLDVASILAGDSEPARLLQAVVDPARPRVVLELDVDGWRRQASWWPSRTPHCEFAYETVTVRRGNIVVSFQELLVSSRPGFGPGPERIDRSLQHSAALLPVITGRLRHGRDLVRASVVEPIIDDLAGPHRVVVLPLHGDLLGLRNESGRLLALAGPGSGESGCHRLLQAAFGTVQSQLRLLGSIPATEAHPAFTVWLARRIAGIDLATGSESVTWTTLDRLTDVVGTAALDDAVTLAALNLTARSDLMPEQLAWQPGSIDKPLKHAVQVQAPAPTLPYTNPDLSLLAFQERVLALAQDRRMPAPERLRYLAIVGSNIDEFFMVRVAALGRAVEEHAGPGSDGMLPAAVLDAVRIRARRLTESAYRCLVEDVKPALQEQGIRVCRWVDADAAARAWLQQYFLEQIQPLLTPLAVGPGNPFPHIASFNLALAVMIRQPSTGARHLATVMLPPTLPRFIPLPEPAHFIPVEAVVCANVDRLFVGVEVERAHAFRVTRGADIHYDGAPMRDVLQAVEEQVARRPFEPVVRLEVEHNMPLWMRELLLQEFRFEVPGRVSDLGHDDIHEYDWLAGLRTLRSLADRLTVPVTRRAHSVFAADTPIFGQLDARDCLVHFPYDSFADSAERFLIEAADDPAVEAIKLTLYRTDDGSGIRSALLRAVGTGKAVVVVLEVTARFDEAHNIAWARELRTAGVQVSYGVPHRKTHAKLALVVRRDGEKLRRYSFIGTGNFNSATARLYTDLGLFTADATIGAEINSLFNNLTGLAADWDQQRLLVAPVGMLPRLLELIAREVAHAQAGRPARLRAKLNGVDDPEVIEALYHASQQGVNVELIVRGICSLQPGIPGVSDRIRVVSILGPLLEHARVIHFGNDGADEYLIGSADWRMRNLRSRMEVYAPVKDAAAMAYLDQLLTRELADVTAWELGAEGVYRRHQQSDEEQLGVQEMLLRNRFGGVGHRDPEGNLSLLRPTQ